MHRDDEPELKSAFAELHRRQREQAPPFGAMRERALREAQSRPSARRFPAMRRIQWAAASVCVAAAALWWLGRGPELTTPTASPTDSTQRVEQLLTSIEQELDLNAAISSPDFPTDILLTQNQTHLFP